MGTIMKRSHGAFPPTIHPTIFPKPPCIGWAMNNEDPLEIPADKAIQVRILDDGEAPVRAFRRRLHS